MALENDGKVWSWEETILAFDLYSRTQYSKISANNPEVINLAAILKRKPGAVAKKLFNIAAHDPEQLKRGVVSLSHSNKFDKEIWNAFEENNSGLIKQSAEIKAALTDTPVEYSLEYENADSDNPSVEIEVEVYPGGETREATIAARIGQGYFRDAVLSSYDFKCCVTGLNEKRLLNASHIKPWKVSDPKTERTNPRNGLCLNALHDKAFDQGYITINDRYEIVMSKKIKEAKMDEETRDWLYSYDGKQILLPKKFFPSKEFIEYHNDVIFLR